MSELPVDTIRMIDGAEASEMLALKPKSFKWASPELPFIDFMTSHQLYPEQYITALSESDEWTNRESIPSGTRAFARSAIGHQAVQGSIDTFETRIDNYLKSTENVALSNEEMGSLLFVKPKTVAMWKLYGDLPRSAILFRQKQSIPPHLLFNAYHWRTPASFQPDESERQADTTMLTRPEASGLLRISVSGFQKTEQHLHTLEISTGGKRFPRHYITALLSSTVAIENATSPTRAAMEFAKTPLAARAIAADERMLIGRINETAHSGGQKIDTAGLADILHVSGRTIRKWQTDGTLAPLPKVKRGDLAIAPVSNVQAMLNWRYPENYPQNR